MKKQLLALVGLGLLLATASASAQTLKVKADIPFDFVVNKASMPAGEYTIQSLGDLTPVLVIRDANGKAKEMVVPNSCESLNKAQQTKLVFHRYGDRYFLSQIWSAGETAGREIPKGSRELEVALDYPMQDVVLMAKAR
jgi:hypothetical protein